MKKPVKTKPKKTVKNSIPVGLQEGLTKIEPGATYILTMKRSELDSMSLMGREVVYNDLICLQRDFERSGSKLLYIAV